MYIVITGENCHTGEYIAEEISKVIDEVGPEKISAVVSDNAANMRSAWAIIQEKYDHIFCYGCVAHGLHLLANDLCAVDSISKLVIRAKEIVKLVKYKHVPHAVFERVQRDHLKNGKPLQLLMPSATRWGTVAAMLQRLIHVQKSLQYMVMEEEVDAVVTGPVKTDILDSSVFWVQLKKLHSLMQPFADAIRRIESDRPGLSEVPQIFHELQQHLDEALPQSPVQKREETIIKKKFEQRRDFCISKLQLVAHLLDPKYCGIRLTEEQTTAAYDTICQLASMWITEGSEGSIAELCMAELAEFRAKGGIWKAGATWDAASSIPAATWWKGLFSNKALTKIAARVLSLPATSATAERNWSTHKHIQSAKRNRLTEDRTQKLVNIAFNLSSGNRKRKAAAKCTSAKQGKDSNSDSEVSDNANYATDMELEINSESHEQVDENEELPGYKSSVICFFSAVL